MLPILYKEVSIKALMKKDKKVILLLIIEEIKLGNSPSKISLKHNIKKQTLQYYLRQLKKNGIIIKQGYGVWKVIKEVSKSTKASKKVKQIRGHGFNWKVKLNKEYDWTNLLKNNKINYQLIGINQSTPRIIFNDKKIWLTKNGLVIYEPKSFFSESSFTSKGMAVYELDRTLKLLENRLKINIGKYYFTTSREHYGMIKNELAKQYNDKGEKLYIRDNNGLWLWIDDSHSLNELETGEPNNSRGVQNWYNDMKKNNFEVTSSFILKGFDDILKIQTMHSNNIIKHQKVLDEMLITLKKIQISLDKK